MNLNKEELILIKKIADHEEVDYKKFKSIINSSMALDVIKPEWYQWLTPATVVTTGSGRNDFFNLSSTIRKINTSISNYLQTIQKGNVDKKEIKKKIAGIITAENFTVKEFMYVNAIFDGRIKEINQLKYKLNNSGVIKHRSRNMQFCDNLIDEECWEDMLIYDAIYEYALYGLMFDSYFEEHQELEENSLNDTEILENEEVIVPCIDEIMEDGPIHDGPTGEDPDTHYQNDTAIIEEHEPEPEYVAPTQEYVAPEPERVTSYEDNSSSYSEPDNSDCGGGGED